MQNPIKNGLLKETKKGKMILVNNYCDSYLVDELTATVWDLMDGSRSIKQIAKALTKNTSLVPEFFEQDVSKIYSKMKNVNLAV